MTVGIGRFFRRNDQKFEGIAPVNIFLMRMTYFLMAIFLSKDAWGTIFSHRGEWNPLEAVAWTVWAAFALFAVWGLFKPTKLIPLLLFEIAYKLIWLAIVAVPKIANDTLAGSTAETIAISFAWVVLPIAAVPWAYVVRTFFIKRAKANPLTEK